MRNRAHDILMRRRRSVEALAFLAPWIIALAAFIGIVRGIRRSRRHRQQ